MKNLIHRIATRHTKKRLGREHINKQRRTAMILIITGLFRVCIWASLIIMYLLGVSFTKTLFASVAFVAVISLYANGATDFGQVAASLAQLTAGDVHHSVNEAISVSNLDTEAIEKDLEKLAKLNPGPESDKLAAEIQAQIAGR